MGRRQTQSSFLYDIARLILWVEEHEEWDFTLGDGFRDKRAFGAMGEKKAGVYGHINSFHKKRLAIDLNLFVDGDYITGDHPAWREIGAYWKNLHPENTWGGDFNDSNHFSRGEGR
jgi:hypothetical protein